jgi:hypothetical protein
LVPSSFLRTEFEGAGSRIFIEAMENGAANRCTILTLGKTPPSRFVWMDLMSGAPVLQMDM